MRKPVACPYCNWQSRTPVPAKDSRPKRRGRILKNHLIKRHPKPETDDSLRGAIFHSIEGMGDRL